MKPFVIVATKGRAKETKVLLDYLLNQSLMPHYVVVVGSEQSDIEGLETHPFIEQKKGELVISNAGLCIQRNAGIETLLTTQPELAVEQDWFVTFFDDDFRPAQNWIAEAQKYFTENTDVVGITGLVLADGVHLEFGIPEEEAQNYLTSQSADTHEKPSAVQGLYGCNMAYAGKIMQLQRFDENLPMYSWQEDYDFAHRALKYGVLRKVSATKGVHLGTSNGRTSGVRFGYSQIANPLYLIKKGSMPWPAAVKLMSKNVASNSSKTLRGVRIKDYSGRLKGNARAISDLIRGKLNPLNVLNL
ncbi:glycosyltransferase family 2 protein [Oceanisphaera avium]|uniref:Glycosyl transferase n=1 Tax=Oceanisphaera avium TaxID=1903694 RepID=A0A1Y0CZ77_9GAMM|nr:glycosyltransferase family 2 protein [Oceanisphaera avium]ART80631.1 hypothetical protein CBP12_11145 [Oceanisphaera avium]